MALFKHRHKEVEVFESEMSLPSFRIDPNGFIIFEDESLGGACVMEVVPHVSTEGMTHEDPLFHNDSTDFSINPSYEPSGNALFGNMRGWVFPPWVSFLNSLQPEDKSEKPTHIQILAKKCRSEEWYTRIDYADYMAHKELDSLASQKDLSQDGQEALLGARAADYLSLLDAIKEKTDALSPTERDIRSLAAYKTRFFIVISYTPTGEGWWMDGRDSDYYISDHKTPFLSFTSSQDRIVEKVVDVIASRAQRKSSKSGPSIHEDDFFHIESERTAQVLTTRVHRMEESIRKWEKERPMFPMPFHLVKMDGREVAALMNFFPNIMTPYWDKIWELNSDQNDMLYNFDIRNAMALNDAAALGDQKALFDDIKTGSVDMKHAASEQERFLNRFKDKDFTELPDIHSEYEDLFWSPEREEEEEQRRQDLEQARQQYEQDDVWSDFAEKFALEDGLKGREQKKEEFLDRYRKRGSGSLSNLKEDARTKNDDSDMFSMFGGGEGTDSRERAEKMAGQGLAKKTSNKPQGHHGIRQEFPANKKKDVS